jgi:hypothetical protein
MKRKDKHFGDNGWKEDVKGMGKLVVHNIIVSNCFYLKIQKILNLMID